jgi:Ca-activated chloride channel family protein
VPKIFTKETNIATQSSVMEGAYQAVPTAKGVASQVLKGIDWSVAPPLFGYVATKPKSGAEILLTIDSTGDPLLARMSVGLGKTGVFTSDVKSRWSPEWIRWGGYSTFWAQVVRDMMRRKVQERFELHTEAQGESFKAVVDAVDDAETFVNGITSELVLFDPEKPSIKRKFPLYQVAAGRYEGDFTLPGFGSYVIEAHHKKDGQSLGQSRATVSQSYPREHLSFEQNTLLLAKAAVLTGGIAEAAPALLFDPKDQSVQRYDPLWPYFVLAALVLFILDVFFRRVRFGRV